jgi:hypothetical protein
MEFLTAIAYSYITILLIVFLSVAGFLFSIFEIIYGTIQFRKNGNRKIVKRGIIIFVICFLSISFFSYKIISGFFGIYIDDPPLKLPAPN